MADFVQGFFNGLLIRFLDMVKHIAGLMSPAVLCGDLPIHQRQGSFEPFAPIRDDEFEE